MMSSLAFSALRRQQTLCATELSWSWASWCTMPVLVTTATVLWSSMERRSLQVALIIASVCFAPLMCIILLTRHCGGKIIFNYTLIEFIENQKACVQMHFAGNNRGEFYFNSNVIFSSEAKKGLMLYSIKKESFIVQSLSTQCPWNLLSRDGNKFQLASATRALTKVISVDSACYV